MAGADARAATDAILPLLEKFSAANRPAIAAVVVTTTEVVPPLVRGLASTKAKRPAGPDTLFYIASQTKSYVGLLAALLDRKGSLRLDATLADVWPGLSLPGPVDAGRISMLDLLSHQLPLSDDDLVTATSWREEVPAADIPARLAASQPRDPGYRYDNLGYLVYAAALETATGTSWKDWLQQEVCRPLGLTRTSARTGDFALAEVAWRHRREGSRWQALPPKPDALMHAAGGLITSLDDLAAWMQANLRRSAPGLPPEVFRRAHRAIARAPATDGPFTWTHYALGQQVGVIAGFPVVGHRGGYEGARSMTIFSPLAGTGLAVAVSADFNTRQLLDAIAAAFFSCLAARCRAA